MKPEGFIQISEICLHYDLAPEYLFSLRDHGLLAITEEANEWYLEEAALVELERVLRLQEDLQLNLDGIAVIQHLLERIHAMQQEIRVLKSRPSSF
jgi:hypothetical protein